MKSYYIIFAFFLFLVSSCKKEDPIEFGIWGEASAEFSGDLNIEEGEVFFWSAVTNAFPQSPALCENCFSLIFRRSNKDGINLETLIFDFLPLPIKVGKINTTIEVLQQPSTAVTSFSLWDGPDVVIGRYIIFEENEDNFIEFTSVEEKNNRTVFEGRFSGSYVLNPIWVRDGMEPDTIHIRNGVFRGRLAKFE